MLVYLNYHVLSVLVSYLNNGARLFRGDEREGDDVCVTRKHGGILNLSLSNTSRLSTDYCILDEVLPKKGDLTRLCININKKKVTIANTEVAAQV